MTASPKMPELLPLDLDEAEKKIEIASETLGELCEEIWAGRIGAAWHWEIPANEERDTDLRLGAAIQIAKNAVDELRKLRRTPPPAPSTPASVLGDAKVILESLKAAPAVTAFERAAEVVARHIQGKEGV